MSDDNATPGAINPNPDDWTDVDGAADILGVDRSTVYDYSRRHTILAYKVGKARRSLYWVPELHEVKQALARIGRVRRG